MSRDRLLASILLALAIHAAAFVLLELFLKFRLVSPPDYGGPLYVELETEPVIQRAREPAPQRGPARAVESTPGAITPTPTSGPAAGSAAGAEEPPRPSGSPFRLEGAPAQAAGRSEEGTRPRPSGQGMQTPSEEPTLPPAGVRSAPLRAEAVPSRSAGGQPLQGLESLDRALAQGSGAPAGGAAAAAGAAATSRTGTGSEELSREGIPILWDDPAQGREPTYTPRPRLPEWVSKQGQRLTVEVSFLLTPQGVLQNVKVDKGSGYSEVDAAVLDALRLWKFKPVNSAILVRGRVPYLILPGSR